MKQFICALTLSLTSSMAFASSITVTGPDELATARQVSSTLSDLTAKVTRCVDQDDKEIEVCRCEAEGEIARLSEVYDEAVATFPQWADKTVNFTKGAGSTSTIALNFKMLPKAIANACQ